MVPERQLSHDYFIDITLKSKISHSIESLRCGSEIALPSDCRAFDMIDNMSPTALIAPGLTLDLRSRDIKEGVVHI